MKILLTFDYKSTESARKFEQALGRFDQTIEGLLLEVVASTILREVKRRFKLKEDAMATFVENPTSLDSSKLSAKQRARLSLVRSALEAGHAARASSFFAVEERISNAAYAKVIKDSRSITVGIGEIARLDELKSPSATPILTGKGSTSPYNILWRQLEFGTGLFRKPYPGGVAATRYTDSKGWWYGPKVPSKGIYFKGTRPGNFLRDRTGIPYSQDALRFSKLFGQRLTQLLRG